MSELLQFIEQFVSLDETELVALTKRLKRINYEKGDFFIRDNQICRHLCFLEKGSAKAFFNKEDKEVITWFAFPNQTLTAFYSFTSQTPSIENIQFLENSVVYAITYQDLNDLYKRFHNVERLGRLITEHYYRWQEERINSLQFHTAKERYEKLLKQEPYLLQKVSLGNIASYLGISQETLSRNRH